LNKELNMSLFRKPLILSLALIAAASVLGSAARAHEIYSDQAPPEPRTEGSPAHRDGYVWGPGYWSWDGKKYHWVPGTYLVERQSKHWVPEHWEQEDSRWHFVAGRWEK
jgi:hypothetical protein